MLEQLNYTPVLKKDIYDGWFVKIVIDLSGVDGDKVTEVLEEVKINRAYDKMNKAYQADAIQKIEEWKAKMPEIKKRLENIYRTCLRECLLLADSRHVR